MGKTTDRPILIVGGTGVFGGHLARQLALTGRRELILAGRHEERATAILAELRGLGSAARFAFLDRTRPDLALLQRLAPAVIVDAAGPFQFSPLTLALAAVEVGSAYIDLSDARDFVARFPALDGAAQQAGVALITGASSTPALTHAVLDRLTDHWDWVDRILVAIAPGNRVPRGRAVIEAILSYTGAPIRVWNQGEWQVVPGWSHTERISVPGVGRRLVALCETPDLDLLVTRYRPRGCALLKAGLELPIMHYGLSFLSGLRRMGLATGFRPLAPVLQQAADWLKPFGTDRGGMVVQASGWAAGEPVAAWWSVAAPAGLGPIIPALPALCLIDRLDGLAPGARAAAGEVGLGEMLCHFMRLGISVQSSDEAQAPA